MTLFEAILTALTSFFAISMTLYAVWQMKRTKQEVMEIIPDFDNFFKIEEVDGKRQIAMDERIVMFIDAFGTRVAQSLKMSFLQGMGVDAKLSKGLKTAMTQDILEEKMPLLNLGLDVAGDMTGYNVKKYITKNPEAIGQLFSMIAPGIAKAGGINALMGKNNGRSNQSGNVPLM